MAINHKLSRLHYVIRATAEKAKFTAEVAVGILAIHQRDMQLMNNSVMETTSIDQASRYFKGYASTWRVAATATGTATTPQPHY
eukprot:scaffold94401_cov23-Cyclotella_meneghiniana.AAC.1